MGRTRKLRHQQTTQGYEQQEHVSTTPNEECLHRGHLFVGRERPALLPCPCRALNRAISSDPPPLSQPFNAHYWRRFWQEGYSRGVEKPRLHLARSSASASTSGSLAFFQVDTSH